MSILSCLDEVSPPAESLILDGGIFNVVASLLFLSIAAVAFGAPLIRHAYKKRVTRLMCLNQVQPRPASWWAASNPLIPRAPKTGTVEENDIDGLKEQAARWELRITTATVAGWFAFMITGVFIAKWVMPGSAWFGQVEFAFGAGVLALAPLLVNLPERFKRKTLIIMLIAIIVGIGVLEAIDVSELGQQASSVDDEPSGWLDYLSALILGAMLITVFHRRFRGLILPSAVVVTVFVLAFSIPIALLEGHVGSCLSGLAAVGATVPNSGDQQVWNGIFGVVGATLAALGIWLGFQAVGLLTRLVERGWLGDLSMVTIIGLALITTGMVFGVISESDSNYTASIAWAPLAWLLPPVAVYILVLGKRPQSGPGKDLLLLRVFSKDKKQQKLLAQVQARWRYFGAVNQAGGPDLVDLNVDPYECSMFLSSRLHDLYLPAALNGEALAARFNKLPDREGRYRINEMFNFNTAWRENVEQLLLLSKTILLDLRGLTAEREGTSFEIGLLARNRLLDRVVAIGDDKTDWSHVGKQLSEAGQSLSQLKRIDIDKNLDDLFTELLEVATRD